VGADRQKGQLKADFTSGPMQQQLMVGIASLYLIGNVKENRIWGCAAFFIQKGGSIIASNETRISKIII